jgi:hypothetical protein
MEKDDEYLDYLEPYFLEDIGFNERQQYTTDSVRSVEWVMEVPTDDNETKHEVAVSYEVSISDNPTASWKENLSWYFEGVYLKTISLKKRKQYELFRSEMDGINEDAADFLEDGTLTRTSLPIATKQELEDFVKNLKKI